MSIQEAYQRAATAGRILQTGRFELARILLEAFDSCRLGQTGAMTWVDTASIDLTEADRQLDHEGVKNYYRTSLGYPHRRHRSCVVYCRPGAVRYCEGI